jgi:hypothetical protein
MNIFLRTRIFRNLISYEPGSLLVEYATAYSVVPGRIHAEGLAIRGRDSHVEWILRIDRCDFWVSFLDLLRRKFHASQVRGDGLVLRVRLRVGEATTEHNAALPPVPGFADPPYKAVGPASPPLSDAEYDLWSIQLDDVDANHVRELWIDTLRYSGDLRVRGRWFFRPVRWLDVGPSFVDARALDVSYGTRSLATSLQGTLEARVHPFDVRVPNGVEILDQVSASIRLRGRLRAADGLDALFRSDRVAFVRGEGPVDAVLVVDHGVLVRGTHIETEASDGEVRAASLSFDGSVRASLDVRGGANDQATALVSLVVSNFGVSNLDGATARAESVAATLESHELALSHGFADATLGIDVRGGKTPSLRPWMPVWARIDVQSGDATADGHLEGSLAERSAHGELAFSVQELSAGRGNDRMSGSASAKIRLDRLSVQNGLLSLGPSRLDVRNASARVAGVELRAPTLVAHLAGQYRSATGQLDLTDSDVVLRDLVFRIGSGAARPNFTATSVTVGTPRLVIGHAALEGRVAVDLARAEMTDLAALQGALPMPADVVIEHGSASGSARFEVELPSLATRGSADLAAAALTVRAASRTITGNLFLKVRAQSRGAWTDASGTAVVFESVPAPASPSSDWWARAELAEAEFRMSPGFGLRATVHATAKDASPATAMIASRTSIPLWILNAVPMNGLEVTCGTRAAPSSFEIRSLVAHDVGTDLVRLEYAKREPTTDWAVLVETGAIHAGFSGGEGGTQFVLFGARPWFEERVAAIRSHESDGW